MKAIIKIFDSLGNVFTVADVAKMFNKSTASVHETVRETKSSSLKDIVTVINRKIANFKQPIIIKDKNGNSYRVVEVGKLIGRSRSWVIKQRAENNCILLEDFATLNKTGVIKVNKGKSKPTVKKFSRTFCYRNNFMDKCDFYSSCMDARIIGNHHDRFRTDGSCFKSKKDMHDIPFVRGIGTCE